MSSRMIFSAAMAVMSLVLAAGCAPEAKKKPRSDTFRIRKDTGKSSYTFLEFQERTQSSSPKPELSSTKEDL